MPGQTYFVNFPKSKTRENYQSTKSESVWGEDVILGGRIKIWTYNSKRVIVSTYVYLTTTENRIPQSSSEDLHEFNVLKTFFLD